MWILHTIILLTLLASVANCKVVVNRLSDKHTYDIIDDGLTPSPLLRQESSGQIKSYVLKPLETDLDFVDYSQLKDENNEVVIDLPPPPPTIKPVYILPEIPKIPKIPKISKTQDPFISEVNTPDYASRHLNDVLMSEDEMPSPPPPPPAVRMERNHTVFNLVFDGEKDSWCEVKTIRQIVTHAHCNSREMENFVCVGSCLSYSVPQSMPGTPGDEMLDYCDSCQAQESFWTTVELDCEEDGSFYTVTKNIQKIAKCACAPCDKARRYTPTSTTTTTKKPTEPTTTSTSIMGMPAVLFNSLEPLKPLHGKNFNQISMQELKDQFLLNEAQEKILTGKIVNMDIASFRDDDDGEEDEKISN